MKYKRRTMGSLSRFDLNRIIQDFKTPNLFETGTFWGDGVAYALEFPFDKIISVEIIPEIADKAKSRFREEERVEIIEADSVTGLEEQLPLLNGNTVFWLDAHFPGADAKLADYEAGNDMEFRLPLKMEIEHISKHRNNFQDVLILDDLRIYEDGPFEKGPVPSNALPKGERGIDFIYNAFEATHYIFKSFLDEGYILLLPKKGYDKNHNNWEKLLTETPVIQDIYLLY